jgi:hypothetical protein
MEEQGLFLKIKHGSELKKLKALKVGFQLNIYQRKKVLIFI